VAICPNWPILDFRPVCYPISLQNGPISFLLHNNTSSIIKFNLQVTDLACYMLIL
jgi:hypothetical protein